MYIGFFLVDDRHNNIIGSAIVEDYDVRHFGDINNSIQEIAGLKANLVCIAVLSTVSGDIVSGPSIAATITFNNCAWSLEDTHQMIRELIYDQGTNI